ncbi:BAG family molecular chaperone regulator 6-like protein [Drosera capensis]
MFPVFGHDPFPIRSQQPLKESRLPRPEFITPQIKVDPVSRPPYEPYGYPDQVQGPAGSYPYHYPYYYGYQPPQPHLPPPPAYPYPMTLNNEEQVKEPDITNGSDNQLPSWLEGFPYPVMWIPRGRIKGADQEKESDEAKHQSDEAKLRKEPNVSAFPWDMKGIKPMVLGGKDQSAFPVFWLPSGSSGIDAGKNGETKAHEKHGGGRIEEVNAREPDVPPEVSGHENVNKREEKVEQKSNIGDKVTKESAKNGAGKNPSSPRSIKLPPVCLRVDPLPKKRQGATRSPSPPKQKQGQVDNNAVQQGVVDKKTANDSKHENKEAGEAITEQNEQSRGKLGETVQENQQANKPVKKILSGVEAATVIQSAFRGYELRRCEPLKKLIQIVEVRKEAVEIKNRIDCIESCHGATMDAKERVILGETIMKLLLKLDTIQGLHWSLRHMRKSVAKELVGLQEKLDSLVNQSSASSSQEMPTSQIAEVLPTSSTHEDGPAGGETEVKSIDQHDDPGSQQPFPSDSPAVPDAVNEASEVVDPADVATRLARGLSESVTSEVVPLMEQGAADETVKGRGDTLTEASEPSPVIGENQQVMEVALSKAHDDSDDFEKIEKGGNDVLAEALESSPAVVENQQIMEASLSAAPELLEKTANEEAELATELPRTDPEEEESAHEGTSVDLQEKLGCNEPHVVKDVPMAVNEESVVELMEQQSTLVLDSEVPTAQVGDDGDDQVNVSVQESPSVTDASAMHVEEENQMQEFCDEAETLKNSAAMQSERDSAVDEEVDASGFSTCQVLDMSEATNEVIQPSITEALADLEAKSIIADAVDANASKVIQVPESTREEGFAFNKEDVTAPATQEKEEHDIAGKAENVDDEMNEMIKGQRIGNDSRLVESSTILDMDQDNVDLEHKKPDTLRGKTGSILDMTSPAIEKRLETSLGARDLALEKKKMTSILER